MPNGNLNLVSSSLNIPLCPSTSTISSVWMSANVSDESIIANDDEVLRLGFVD
ncbi:MAG: hypothetical protein ACK4FV_03985 [Candidatus Nitrosocaldus sp.]